jgi:hypothetical protein
MERLEQLIAANVLLGREYMEPIDAFGDITI